LVGGDAADYDDDFENSLAAEAEAGEGSGMSEEVVDKLNDTARKVKMLEHLLGPEHTEV
jgi:hypothetical protein